ncbi:MULTISPECIES: response regulator transcription factor [Microvirgula]|uniref:DNA-binding response regulator n=1 Tax=Microvirgula aerodenitrificans TaxID=57480 RepID=A0A2S0PC94_9NEIS|nr:MULTISPECIES: response regulator transcription factor [Microvirgula]AVY94952.1 DNA-binding response regulator [Microvirgula aerodenitrificans]RAS10656.1 LuxR family two component transcriptional regulator [Microvirgula sp. AG722]
MPRARLLLIDDHTLFRTGLRLVLADCPLLGEIFEAGSIMEAVQTHGTMPVDIILLDIQLPGLNGLDGVRVLLRYFRSARILVVSGSTDNAAAQAAEVPGVVGFLSKSATAGEIEEAIACCLRGERHFPQDAASPATPSPQGALTPRQLEVLGQLCLGRSNKVIAHHMGLSENTIRVHVAAILDHLGVFSRTEAVLEAMNRGLVQKP